MAIGNYSEANFKQIDTFLKKKGLNCNARAGLIGNLYKESKLIPNNLQNSYEGKAPYYWTDKSYTEAVDTGSYTKFCSDRHGYGLCQWTSSGRKQGYYNYAKSMNKSIGDMNVALEYLWKELNSSSYKKQVLPVLKKGESVDACARIVMLKFERPANQTEANQKKRVAVAQEFYDKYYASSNSVDSVISSNVSTSQSAPITSSKADELDDNLIYITYKIEKGDTLNKIAKKFNTTVDYLCSKNPKIAANPNLIKTGDTVIVGVKEEETPSATVIITTSKVESAKSYNKSLAKSYQTTADMYLRSGAGSTKTKMAIVSKGTKVKCYGYYTSVLGTKWLLVKVTIGTKAYTGFCSSSYLKEIL